MRTIFNLLGPLTNPAGARRQVVGVADPASMDLVAGALARLGTDRALVVSSADGLDELSTSGPTHVVEVEGEQLTALRRRARGVSGSRAAPSRTSRAARPQDNARDVRAILAGEPGPRTDLALLNAGAAIYAAGRADSIAEGVEQAREARRRGRRAGRARRATCAIGNELAGRRVSDARPDHRRRRARRSRAAAARCRSRSSSAGSSARGPDRPFAEALGRAGVSVIAEFKRRSPSAGDIRAGATVEEIVAAYESAGRGGAVDPHRGPELRRLARRPARGARRQRPADPAQGLRRRPLPAGRVGGRRRRRGAADRRGARGPRARRPPRGGGRARPRRARRGPRPTRSSSARSRPSTRPDRDQQPRPRRPVGRRRAHLRAARRRARRQDGRQRVGDPLAASSCSSSSASASTRC